MSTGGIFQLITNEGKQDRMLLATQLLNKRLLAIERQRGNDPKIRDPTPTLADIERTHLVFVNAHFKPFAAIGYEYSKVNPGAGGTRLGGTDIQFSIPQFGDFFNDMALHVKLSSVTATNSAYWSDPLNNPANGAELVRYVNYPGQRLVKNVRFDVNGNPLDKYSSDVMNMHQKFFVTPNKNVGWSRAVGQEVPYVGYQSVSSVGTATAAYTGRGAGVRQQLSFVDGYQTPKATQPDLDMFIPLLFWFNEDPRLSIPSVSIPYGQRWIYFDFCQANELLQHCGATPSLDDPGANPVTVPDVVTCELYINNIFVNPEIHDIYIKRIGFNLIRTHITQVFNVTKSNDSLLVNNLKWPVETLYLGMRPRDNISTSSTQMLDNWNSYAYKTENGVNTAAMANAYTVSGIPAGLTGANINSVWINTSGVAAPFVALATYSSWAQLNAALHTANLPPIALPDPAPAFTAANIQAYANANGINARASYWSAAPTISTIGIQAQGVDLYRDFPAGFYNSYIPYTYGGTYTNTPDDIGVLMVTFNLYPRTYQPSGYLNVSRAREFYINYSSDLVGSTVSSADFVVTAVAINFLLVSDGSAVLRYAT